MRRLTVVLMHLLALPVALLLSLIVAIILPPTVSQRAAQVALHDTYFVVAHFHASVILGCCVVVATVVAYECNSLNWALNAAWAFFILHLVAAFVAWRVSVSFEPQAPVIVSMVPPAHPGSAYFYLGSAVAALAVTLLGLIASLVRAVQSARVESA